MYILLLLLIYLAFISLGLPDSLLGAGWPVMQQVFDVPLSYAGLVTMIISLGTICSSLLSDRLTKRLGARIVTVASVFLTAVALFGFSTASQFWMLCLWAVPYGLGAGAIDAALNNYVALHYSSRHMSWLHCFWGVGTIVSPYIMSYALLHAGWQSGYRMVSLLQIVITVILLVTLPLWKVNEKKAGKRKEGTKALGLRETLGIPGVPPLLTGFFAYCAVESTMMLWASTYLVRTRQMPKELAAAFGSLFFIGITAGRFLSGLVSDRLGDRRLIRIGACVMAAGILCIAIPANVQGFVLGGFVIVGLGCAPVYPSIIHSTPNNFGEENSQAIIGIQMASAYVGSTFMPPIFGVIANHVSIYLMPFYILVFTGLMIYMIEKTFRGVEKRKI